MGFAVLKPRSRPASVRRESGETQPWAETAAPALPEPANPRHARRVVALLTLICGVSAVLAAMGLAPLLDPAAGPLDDDTRRRLLHGALAGAASLLLLSAVAVILWQSHRVAARTLRQTVNELRRGTWESAVEGLRTPRRAVPSAFGDLATQVEDVIGESERRWQARAELSTDWYWELDTQLRLSTLAADAPIAKPAGRALGDLLGRRHDELDFCQPPAMGWPAFHEMLEQQQAFRDVEVAVRGLGDKPRGWVAFSGRPRRNRQGLFAGYEGVARDITASKEAFRRLQASEQRYAVMAGLSADWYWLTDADHRFPPPSPELVRRFGQLVTRKVGQTRWDAYADAMSADQWAAHRAELEARQPFRGLEFAITRDDGRTIWISLAGAPRFDEMGHFIGYHGVGRDITLRKMTEQMLVQHNHELQLAVAARTRELELANRDLDAFARQLAHELRTPIGHVQGLAELLQQRLAERLQPGDSQLLQMQMRAAHDMLVTLEALLELARSSSAAIERQAVDLSALAFEVIAGLPAIERAAPIHWDIQPELVAWASPVQLRIVLQNLFGNAAKFTRQVPHPVVQFSGQRDDDGQLLLCIADNGAGFKPEQAQRLFQPFQRLHRQEEFHGTGIGLTIVQRIVQRHGGQIAAYGEPGHGARFEFTLGQRDGVRPEAATTVPDRLPNLAL